RRLAAAEWPCDQGDWCAPSHLAFHVSDRGEARDWFADSGQVSGSDHFVDVFVSGTGFLGQTGPRSAANVNAARFKIALELFAVPLFARFGTAHGAPAAVRGAKKCLGAQ